MDRRDFLKNGTAFAGLMSSGELWTRMPLRGGPHTSSPASSQIAPFDLRNAVVYAPAALTRREQRAARMLVEEVETRTGILWPVRQEWPASAAAVISVAALHTPGLPAQARELHAETAREGYTLRASRTGEQSIVRVTGADERGVLFGVGGLLRQLHMGYQAVTVAGGLDLSTHPHYSLRGHQLGYRNLPNTYDAWTPAMFEQYIRELAIFGANAIEFIPPYPSRTEFHSENFTLPPDEMMVANSRTCDAYGLDVWLWYPALRDPYSDPRNVARDVEEWGAMFARMPRLDAVFVPGGDPGHTPPEDLMPLLEKQAANLHRHHPHAQMWVSPQGFDRDWMTAFLNWLRNKRPDWLTGIVYGPGIHIDIAELRRQVPRRYPFRLYPDITHSLSCQYPVPDWDTAYARTEGREVINPRPHGYANIFHLQAPHTIGFLSYSEGVNDDANKALWSALAWNPATPVVDILRDYSRFFFGAAQSDDFAQGLLQLERNWNGPLLANENVFTTLEQFQSMEAAAPPLQLQNWRFQQGLYRAYYDAYTRERLLQETERTAAARERLRSALLPGAPASAASDRIDDALAMLRQIGAEPVAPGWRSRIFALGDALYQNIRMQLSVKLYHAAGAGRGATLDTIDTPLTDAPWLQQQLMRIRALSSAAAQHQALRELLDRTNPGPGGFYDDLGDISRQPHLVRETGAGPDPEFRHSALAAFAFPDSDAASAPLAWKRWAASLYDAPLRMRYDELDPAAGYRLRIVYAGNPHFRIALDAGGLPVHPMMERPHPQRPLEFDVPPQAIRGGVLNLTWRPEDGPGGASRGCQVAEVWLIRHS